MGVEPERGGNALYVSIFTETRHIDNKVHISQGYNSVNFTT